MFAVLFEVNPRGDQWSTYLDLAAMLRPELLQVDGFVDNTRYASLTREGWLLSVSSWRDEEALVRWRSHAGHHAVQVQGRDHVLADYHLRVGQVTHDTHVPDGPTPVEPRLEETRTGAGTTATLLVASRHAASRDTAPGPGVGAAQLAGRLGLDRGAPGLLSWDVFTAVLDPGECALLLTWRDGTAADDFRRTAARPGDVRLRQVRVVRDYGMHDRRESPQAFPAVERRP